MELYNIIPHLEILSLIVKVCLGMLTQLPYLLRALLSYPAYGNLHLIE